jgi:hypothetical protein
MSEISIENLKDELHKMDLMLRPYVCFVHPETLDEIKKVESDIENKILFKTTELIDKDKAVMMKREQLEEWTFGSIEEDL